MAKELKILIDARMVFAQTHGIGRYTLNLIRELSGLGQNVSVITHSPATFEVIGPRYVKEVIHCRADFVGLTSPLELSRLQLSGAFDRFDIVHFPSFDVPPLLPSRQCVVTIHDLIHLHGKSKLHHQLYYRGLVKHALARAAKVITVSEWTRQDIHRLLGTPLEKISVIRNGLEKNWFVKGQGKTSNVPYLLCLSNPKPHKNVHTLLSACGKLWDQGVEFELVLSLGGADIPTAWKIHDDHLQKIVILKRESDESLRNYYMSAHALVSPSLLEGYNFPVAEALALGKCAIVSNSSAHGELKGDRLKFYGDAENTNGLSEVILQTLKEPMDTMGPSSHNILTSREMAEQTLELYRSIQK